MKLELKTTLIYTIAGIIFGIISFIGGNENLALLFALVGLVVVQYALKTFYKINEKFVWFLTNGGWIYLFIWFITWIMLLNRYVYTL